MSHSPAFWIRCLLIREGMGVAATGEGVKVWPVYVGSMPDGKEGTAPINASGIEDNAIAVYNTAGLLDGREAAGRTVEHPGWQVKVRSLDYEAGYAKIKAIAEMFDTIKMTYVVDGSQVTLIHAITRGPVLTLGAVPGNRRRDAFSVNGTVTITF